MKIDEINSELERDLEAAISRIAAYARQVVESEKSASHLAERLNGELPPRFEDLRQSFVANLESRLGDLGEEFVRDLDASIRVNYYEAEIERSVTKGISCSSWPTWHPDLAPKIQTAATGCAILGGVGTCLSLAKALGVLPFKLPILLGSPAATVLLFLAITCAALTVAMRPDGFSVILDHERNKAQRHVDAYLASLKPELTQASRRAAERALVELEKLKTSPDQQSP